MPATQIILLKKSLIRTQILNVILIQIINPQSNSDSSHKFENTMTKILTTQQKKIEEENNKNGIKRSWPRGTCVVIEGTMVAGIDERKMLSKRLIKVRAFQ